MSKPIILDAADVAAHQPLEPIDQWCQTNANQSLQGRS